MAQQVVDISPASFARFLCLPERAAPDVDLLIRTGGEQRLSDFLLWESAYAELLFTPQPWPDFGRDDLAAVLAEFHRRERRFGQVAA
jgi:undecaprenyl diphosphate synthase